jgi:glycosyltransferase involved in cell wall biosynthesis
MKKKKLYMTVMNTLHTDARVQRAAMALQGEYEVTVIGVGKDCGEQNFKQIIIDIKSKNNIVKYFEFIYKCKKILRKDSFAAFYGHDYFSAGLVSWVKKVKPDVKTIYDAHELIVPEEKKTTSKRDLFFYINEKKAVRSADLIICASVDRAEIMKDHYGLVTAPVVIENISELPVLENDYAEELIQKAGFILNSNEPVLVYAGVLVSTRRIDELIDIIKQSPKGKLLIIGDGPDRKRLEEIAENQIHGRYHFTGGLPYQYMGVLLRRCDVGYISYPTNSLNNNYCAPNKIYEYSSVGLPMIAPYNPTIQKFFSEYGIGVIRENLKDAFDVVVADLDKYKIYCNKFTLSHPWSSAAQTLINAINSIM